MTVTERAALEARPPQIIADSVAFRRGRIAFTPYPDRERAYDCAGAPM